MMCAITSKGAREVLNFGFESCNHDCVGAALTDALLAVHAGWSAWRLSHCLNSAHKQHAQRALNMAADLTRSADHTLLAKGATPKVTRWCFGTLAVALMATNAIWSIVGASYWLQPGGCQWPTPASFDILWRINSQCQALLIYVAYLVALTIVRIGAVWPVVVQHEAILTRLALAHALLFGTVCLLPDLCEQQDYVLWGGLNIMPPLITQWAAIVTLVFRHRLQMSLQSLGGARQDSTVAFGVHFPRHALFGAAASGLWFWLGNSAIIVGRHHGIALWIRHITSTLLRLDPDGVDPE